jgi:hypothetical protein
MKMQSLTFVGIGLQRPRLSARFSQAFPLAQSRPLNGPFSVKIQATLDGRPNRTVGSKIRANVSSTLERGTREAEKRHNGKLVFLLRLARSGQHRADMRDDTEAMCYSTVMFHVQTEGCIVNPGLVAAEAHARVFSIAAFVIETLAPCEWYATNPTDTKDRRCPGFLGQETPIERCGQFTVPSINAH